MNMKIAGAIGHDIVVGFSMLIAAGIVLGLIVVLVLFLAYLGNHIGNIYPIANIVQTSVFTFTLIFLSWLIGALWRSKKGKAVEGYITVIDEG